MQRGGSRLPARAPESELLRALWRLNHAMQRTSRVLDKSRGITAQQRLLVRFIGRYPGVSARLLAEQFHLDPGTVSAALDRLEAKGLVQRRRTERDRRCLALGLTAAGRVVDQGAPGPLEAAARAVFEQLPPDDVKVATLVVESLAQRLEAASLGADAGREVDLAGSRRPARSARPARGSKGR